MSIQYAGQVNVPHHHSTLLRVPPEPRWVPDKMFYSTLASTFLLWHRRSYAQNGQGGLLRHLKNLSDLNVMRKPSQTSCVRVSFALGAVTGPKTPQAAGPVQWQEAKSLHFPDPCLSSPWGQFHCPSCWREVYLTGGGAPPGLITAVLLDIFVFRDIGKRRVPVA